MVYYAFDLLHRAEAVGGTNRLTMAVVPGTSPSTSRKSKSMATNNNTSRHLAFPYLS